MQNPNASNIASSLLPPHTHIHTYLEYSASDLPSVETCLCQLVPVVAVLNEAVRQGHGADAQPPRVKQPCVRVINTYSANPSFDFLSLLCCLGTRHDWGASKYILDITQLHTPSSARNCITCAAKPPIDPSSMVIRTGCSRATCSQQAGAGACASSVTPERLSNPCEALGRRALPQLWRCACLTRSPGAAELHPVVYRSVHPQL